MAFNAFHVGNNHKQFPKLLNERAFLLPESTYLPKQTFRVHSLLFAAAEIRRVLVGNSDIEKDRKT
jgi:hypothetical protein